MAETTSNLRTSGDYQETDDPEVIRARIEETRANMTETVNSIQERLAPERLAQQAKDTLKEATIGKVEEMAYKARYKANSWKASLVDTVKQNPIPAAMVGIGLGWLLMKGSDSGNGDYTYYPDSEGNYRRYTSDEWNGPYYEDRPRSQVGRSMEQVRETASSTMQSVQDTASGAAQAVGQKAGEIVDTVQDTARSAAHSVGETAHAAKVRAGEVASNIQQTTEEQAAYLANQARVQARRARNEFQYLMDTNPLAVGVAAVAAGAVIGLLLPSTHTENRLMGETRDQLVDQAKETAKQTARKVQHVAEEAYESAKETVKDEAERENLVSRETAEKAENKLSQTTGL